MPKPIAERILNRIETHSPLSVDLVAMDLSLSVGTVKRHVRALIVAGRVEYGWDGRALDLTDQEVRDRAVDARVRSHR